MIYELIMEKTKQELLKNDAEVEGRTPAANRGMLEYPLC